MQNLSGVSFIRFGHFSFFHIAVLDKNMTKCTCLLKISGTCCALSHWIINTDWKTGVGTVALWVTVKKWETVAMKRRKTVTVLEQLAC